MDGDRVRAVALVRLAVPGRPALVEQERLGELDYEHLGEYQADMALRDRHEVESRLTVLLAHLLKWTHQPEKRTASWRGSIVAQQQELRRRASRGVLRVHAEGVLADVYVDAVARAAAETGLARNLFPEQCPWTVDELLTADFTGEA